MCELSLVETSFEDVALSKWNHVRRQGSETARRISSLHLYWKKRRLQCKPRTRSMNALPPIPEGNWQNLRCNCISGAQWRIHDHAARNHITHGRYSGIKFGEVYTYRAFFLRTVAGNHFSYNSENDFILLDTLLSHGRFSIVTVSDHDWMTQVRLAPLYKLLKGANKVKQRVK